MTLAMEVFFGEMAGKFLVIYLCHSRTGLNAI